MLGNLLSDYPESLQIYRVQDICCTVLCFNYMFKVWCSIYGTYAIVNIYL